MKERPILFSGAMVRAILDGSKTQTRRVVNPQPARGWAFETPPVLGRITSSHPKKERFGAFIRRGVGTDFPEVDLIPCPYGQPGDRLWVRETFHPIYPQDTTYNGGKPIEYDYAATYQHGYRLGDTLSIKKRWTPSIHMPRVASRITLEITGVRVERLQDINVADAMAEGVVESNANLRGLVPCMEHRYAYEDLWNKINGSDSWDENPFVWVIDFRQIDAATSAAVSLKYAASS